MSDKIDFSTCSDKELLGLIREFCQKIRKSFELRPIPPDRLVLGANQIGGSIHRRLKRRACGDGVGAERVVDGDLHRLAARVHLGRPSRADRVAGDLLRSRGDQFAEVPARASRRAAHAPSLAVTQGPCIADAIVLERSTCETTWSARSVVTNAGEMRSMSMSESSTARGAAPRADGPKIPSTTARKARFPKRPMVGE